ncbi:MAG: hypothetical protein HY689_14615 [Chloroflexi bacterium]|nr:hypothetical protein [Chloroflexota bacterium]
MSRHAGVQSTYLRLERIEDDVIQLEGGLHRAVLEVEGIPFDQQSSADQEAVLAGYAAFLNSLTFPMQVLVRIIPADLGPYLTRLERRAARASVALAALAQDHAAFVRRLQRQRTLLERHCYIVVPTGEEARLGWRSWWPFRRRQDRERDAAVARQQLALRCDEIVRELGRCGLEVRRLHDTELAELSYACWCPDLARTQRLRRDLADYTALVVGAARSAARGKS